MFYDKVSFISKVNLIIFRIYLNTLSIFYKQQFISNKLETGKIFRKNKQLTGHFLKK